MPTSGFGFSFGATPPTFDPSFGGDTADNINAAVSTGFAAVNTYEQSKLLSQQVKAGQTPSIVGVPGAPSGALAAALPNAVGLIGSSTSGGIVLVLAVVLVVFLLFRR